MFIKLSAFSDEAADSLKDQIEALHRNDIFLTELRTVNTKSVADITEAEAGEIQGSLKQEGIGLSAVGSALGKAPITVDRDEYMDQVRHICTLANIFETKRIRMFSFFKAYDCPERVLEYLGKMGEIAEEYGVWLCHENEGSTFGDTAERVQYLMDHAKGLRFVYDPANFLKNDQPAEKTLPLADRCDYFHIKDVIMATHQLVPAGYGDGQIPALIHGIDRDIMLTVEPHLRSFGSYQKIDKTDMKLQFHYNSNAESFDAAVKAIKEILIADGYHAVQGGFEK